MLIYFIQAGDDGPVKIGCAENVEKRRSALQTAHHDVLRILRSFPGERGVERSLHERFSNLRIRGEWFRFAPEMLTAHLPVLLTFPPTQKSPNLSIDLGAAVKSYLQQLEARCAGLGVSLDDVCRAEGVANTTLARWRKGDFACREGTARALFARMDKMRPLQEAS
jgi:hypothetical protein